jgi:hypothetical protein
MEEAASIPLVGLTAWQALVERGNSAAGAEGAHPRWLRRRGHFRHPTGEAPRRRRRHDDQHRERRVGRRRWEPTSSSTTSTEDFESNVLRDYDVVLHSLGEDVVVQVVTRVLRAGREARVHLWPA